MSIYVPAAKETVRKREKIPLFGAKFISFQTTLIWHDFHFMVNKLAPLMIFELSALVFVDNCRNETMHFNL